MTRDRWHWPLLPSKPVKESDIVLPQLKSFIHDSLDPFQFAYQSNRSCEDALLVTINEVTSHLDSKLSVEKTVSGIITKSRNSVRMMFFLFFLSFQHHSAAFAGQQNVIYVGPKWHDAMDTWLFNLLFTICCFPIIEIWHSLLEYWSTTRHSFSTFLFSLYTSDCRSSNE